MVEMPPNTVRNQMNIKRNSGYGIFFKFGNTMMTQAHAQGMRPKQMETVEAKGLNEKDG